MKIKDDENDIVDVYCAECFSYMCYHPVTDTNDKWYCKTRSYRGCPDNPEVKDTATNK